MVVLKEGDLSVIYHREAQFYVKVELLRQSTNARYSLLTRYTYSGKFPIRSLGGSCARFDETLIFALTFVLLAIMIDITFILLSLSFRESAAFVLLEKILHNFASVTSRFKS